MERQNTYRVQWRQYFDIPEVFWDCDIKAEDTYIDRCGTIIDTKRSVFGCDYFIIAGDDGLFYTAPIDKCKILKK